MRVLVDRRGPRHHGVVTHARTLARLLRSCGAEVVDGGPAQVTHAQFVDALWGRDVAAAAGAMVAWSATVPRPLVVTLHDLPGADPDPARDRRRGAGYTRVVAAADAAVVSSDHEAARVRALAPGARVEVIELPLPAVPPLSAPEAAPGVLAVLGFVYPGKGHAAVVDAAARRGGGTRVAALGAVSPGHHRLWSQLAARAVDRGVELTRTGRLSEASLTAEVAAAGVPIVPARAVSASASLVRWLAQGRRPLCADGPYAAEVDARHPGWVHRYHDDDGMDRLVDLALGDPAVTWAPRPPPWPDAGTAHLDLYRRLTGSCHAW